MSITKNVLAMHDLSGFGRCALSVIIPTLSSLGVQVTSVPTAVLSTHTGGFTDFTFNDMTFSMLASAEHYEKLGIEFDAVYSGFLGSAKQCEIIEQIIEKNEKSLRFIDPVMGDNGVLYQTYDKRLCDGVAALARMADVITPNITEACILAGEKYTDFLTLSHEESHKRALDLAEKLADIYGGDVVITGIGYTENGTPRVGCAARHDGETKIFFSQMEHKNYPGTGDIFASVVLGCMLTGSDLFDACGFAVDFVHKIIYDTIKAGTPERHGVLLEQNLYMLTEKYRSKE